MPTFCWTVVRQAVNHVHHHVHHGVRHVVHHSGHVLHHLTKVVHHQALTTTLVCRVLPGALAGAGLMNMPSQQIPPTAPAYVQPATQALNTSPLAGTAPFAGVFGLPSAPIVVSTTTTTPSLTPVTTDPAPFGGTPYVVTTSVIPVNPDPPSPVDEPQTPLIVLGGVASLLLLRRARQLAG